MPTERLYFHCHGCGFESALGLSDAPQCKLCGRGAGDILTRLSEKADEPETNPFTGNEQ